MRRLLWIIILGTIAYWGWMRSCKPITIDPALTQRVERHYGEDLQDLCQTYDLPAHYFKALIILEVSARKNPPSRTEASVLKRLKDVRAGKTKKYGFFRTQDLQHKSDRDLEWMATSWGPFQIMGFHAVREGFPVTDLYNEKALATGLRWCKAQYGDYLKRGDLANAFHIHNTGSPLPASGRPFTTDPDYVRKGLTYSRFFQNNPRYAQP
ncbi:MAG: N-acetylmuramidase domain-containing protein [Bernardetiaceae bacterium]